jgi:Spy/CpxP family protein refolding chaperone
MNGALKWKIIAGFVLVFIAGGITGAFVGGAQMRRAFSHGPPHRAAIKQRMTARLQRELSLTPDQANKISPIIDKASGDIEEARTKTAERIHEIMAQAHRDMDSILTDEQRVKLQEMRRRHPPRATDQSPPTP